ncbi:unnamed protein product [Discosporangium mesarthrocarpum]
MRTFAGWVVSMLLIIGGAAIGTLPGAAAEGVNVDIGGRLALPDRSAVPTTKVVLNGGQASSLSALDGSFLFRGVAPGVYLLEVLSTVYHFSHAKVRVDQGGEVTVLEYKVREERKKKAWEGNGVRVRV